MSYKIEIDYSPAYELVISLFAYAKKNAVKGIALSSDWKKAVKSSLSASLSHELEKAELEEFTGLDVLIGSCPDKTSTSSFLDWLEAL